MSFKPNKLRPEDLDRLESWQLLVAACHFGPKMGDCIQLDYSYTFKDKYRWLSDTRLGMKKTIFCEETSLEEDIDLGNPIEALESYAGFDWKEWAKERILNALKERESENEREST